MPRPIAKPCGRVEALSIYIVSNKPRRLDQVGNSHTEANGEFALIGGEVPAENCRPAKKHNGEAHAPILNWAH